MASPNPPPPTTGHTPAVDNVDEEDDMPQMPQEGTDADLQDYIKNAINCYRDEGLTSQELYHSFVFNFKTATDGHFKKAGDASKALRDFLRAHNVFVDKGQGKRVGKELIKTLQKPWQPMPLSLLHEIPEKLHVSVRECHKLLNSPAVPVAYGLTSQVKEHTTSVPQRTAIVPAKDATNTIDESYVETLPLKTEVIGNSSSNNQDKNGSGHHDDNKLSSNLEGETTYDDKSLVALSRLINEDSKYEGTADENLSLTKSTFLTYCDLARVPSNLRGKAWVMMLKKGALNFYHSLSPKEKNEPVDTLIEIFRKVFEGKERESSMLLKWNDLTLQSIIDSQQEKDELKALSILITRLRECQAGLEPALRSSAELLRTKILTACRPHPGCMTACSVPAHSTPDLISQLQSSLMTWKVIQKSSSASIYHANKLPDVPDNEDPNDVHFTDRQYHGQRGVYNKRNQYNHLAGPRNQTRQVHRYNNQNPSYKSSNMNNRKTCFICKREGCWSTRHPLDEQRRHKDRFKDTYRAKHPQSSNTRYLTDSEFDSAFEGFLTVHEGHEDDDDLAQLIEDFHALSSPEIAGTSEQYHTAVGTIPGEQACELIGLLANNVVEHDIFKSIDDQDNNYGNIHSYDSFQAPIAVSRYGDSQFQGILIDTGAAGPSTAGEEQLRAYSRIFGHARIETGTKNNFTFGVGTVSSRGKVTISTPIGKCCFHIVPAKTPFLLGLQDLDEKGLTFDNINNELVAKNGTTIPVVRKFGHAFLQWGVTSDIHSYMTETELRTLHRRFGHPSAQRLVDLLEKAGQDDNSGENRKTLLKIISSCDKCQRHEAAPMRFKFTLRDHEIDFNHTIHVDILYIDNKPVLHIVDEATRFQAARWLDDMTSSNVWNALRSAWIDTYLGPPDIINHDAGSNLTSLEFQQYVESLGITSKQVPVEAAQSMGIVERYHAPLRRAYQIIKEETNSLDKTMILQMAVKAIDDTAGPNGLVPTLLVFGAYPRLTSTHPPTPSIQARAQAINKAMKEVVRLRAKRQVQDAVTMRNGPVTQNIELGSDVLVYRTSTRKWEGPFKLLGVTGETYTIAMPHGPTPFRSTVVKKYTLNNADQVVQVQNHTATDRVAVTPVPLVDYTYPSISINVVETSTGPRPNFTVSRQKELNGLLDGGVFEYIEKSEIPKTARVFNSRFVDQIKREGTPFAFEKSRLVVQAYNDAGKKTVLTQSPTVQRASQRLLISIAVMRGQSLHTRDISQAYTQSTTNLVRNFYVIPPKELDLPHNTMLHILKPLYGIPEAGTHWFRTYHTHHIERLGLKQSPNDACLLYGQNAITALQTDDTLFAGNEEFLIKEQQELQKAGFAAKDVQKLTIDAEMSFNGTLLTLDTKDEITMSQNAQCLKIKMAANRSEYIAERARGAYIASTCQPQASFDLSKAAQIVHPTKYDFDKLNKRLAWQKANSKKGLKFVKLDENSLRIVIFTDSSFANNSDCTSQIGYVIVVSDKTHQCNIIQWSSIKCRRVTRSVLASELYAMVEGFDAGCVLKHFLDTTNSTAVPITLCIDSFSLYECLVKLGTTKEKRLMIDIHAIRQAYERREIAEIIWITSDSNPADAMTKEGCNKALDRLIDTNIIQIDKEAWVDRDLKP